MVSKTIFSRRFSELEGIQRRANVRYGLIEEGLGRDVSYGLEIAVEREGCEERESIANVSRNRREVMDVITYLYENAIRTDFCRDIVSDLLAKDHKLELN